MPRICGFPLKLHSKACYPTIDLTKVTKVEKRPTHNLSTKIPQKKIIYRNNDDIQKLISKVPESHTSSKQDHILLVYSGGNKQPSINATQPTNNVFWSQKNCDPADVKSHISKFQEHSQEKNYNTSSYRHESISTDKLDIQELSLVSGNDTSSTCLEGKHHKTVPVFKTVVRRASHSEQSSTQPQSQKLVPIFRPKTSKPSTVPSIQNEAHNKQHTVDNRDNYVINKNTNPVSVPSFHASQNKDHNKQYTVENAINFDSDVNSDKNTKPVSVPSFHAKKTTNEHSSKGNVKQPLKSVGNLNFNTKAAPKMGYNSSSKKNQNVALSTSRKPSGTAVNKLPSQSRSVNVYDQSPSRNTLLMPSSFNENSQSTSATSYSFQRPIGAVPATPKSHTPVPVTPKSYTHVPGMPKSYTPVQTTPKANILIAKGLASTPCTPAMKRPCPLSNEGTPAMKKPRPKQQVQDINVETMARSNQLNKVNTVTLINWLKERGITCKAKDKKGDLIEKALKLLNLSVPEQ
ncbi:Hypothetical predicted protein [Mytilus galloprovincialis]|uniref:Uncharacterized protein n=1 Tax=Mytilus galloprovincialis TaxID=29158 RepID=A0A8B6FNE9_MYTGA|nr:Hypothetical predicted protein [Mytilus galloprovincialis]